MRFPARPTGPFRLIARRDVACCGVGVMQRGVTVLAFRLLFALPSIEAQSGGRRFSSPGKQ